MALQSGARPSGRRRLIVFMLSLFMAINFADKVAFGLAADPIMGELHLGASAFGALGASFFALFSVTALVAGRLGDRVSSKWLLAGLALVWTAAQLPLLAPVGLAAFFGSRVLLGAGEGPALPAALHAAYRWFPDGRRAAATAVIEAGVPLGSAAAAILVTRTIASAGWHVAFGILGLLSLAWSCVWLAVARPAPATPYSQTEIDRQLPLLPPRAIVFNRTMAGVVVSGFASYWVSAISVIWLPSYLHEGAGLSRTAAGTVLAAAWIVQVPLFGLTGAFSTWLTSRGLPSDVARVWPATAGLAIGASTMIALAGSTSPSLAIAFSALCIASTVVAVTLLPPVVAEIAPVAYRSTALGVAVALASLGGIVAPIVFGRAVEVNGGGAVGYRAAFILMGSFVLAAAIAGQLLMRPREDGERLRRLDPAFEQQALV